MVFILINKSQVEIGTLQTSLEGKIKKLSELGAISASLQKKTNKLSEPPGAKYAERVSILNFTKHPDDSKPINNDGNGKPSD